MNKWNTTCVKQYPNTVDTTLVYGIKEVEDYNSHILVVQHRPTHARTHRSTYLLRTSTNPNTEESPNRLCCFTALILKMKGKNCCSTFNCSITADIEIFLGAFAKLRRGTVSFFPSVRLSAWNNSAPTRRVFLKFGIWVFYKKPEKNQVSLKSNKNDGYITYRPIYIFYYMSFSSS